MIVTVFRRGFDWYKCVGADVGSYWVMVWFGFVWGWMEFGLIICDACYVYFANYAVWHDGYEVVVRC